MALYVKATFGKRFLCFVIDYVLLRVIVTLLSIAFLAMINFNFRAYNDSMTEMIQSYSNYATYGSSAYLDSFKMAFNNFIPYAIKYYLTNIVVSIIIFFPYFIVLPYVWKRQTLGRKITNTKLITHTGKKNIGISNILRREILGTWFLYYISSLFLSGVIFIVTAIIYFVSGRTLIDLIGGTDLVIKDPLIINQDEFIKSNDPNSIDNYDSKEYQSDINDFREYEEEKVEQKEDNNDNSKSDDDDDEYQII